jgi:hypothetical protein
MRRRSSGLTGAKAHLRSDPDEAQRVAEELVAIHKWGPSVWRDAVLGDDARSAPRTAWSRDSSTPARAFVQPSRSGWPYDRETIQTADRRGRARGRSPHTAG